MYRILVWLKTSSHAAFVAVGLKRFQSPTLMRLLDTKDEVIASAAARELLSRLKANFNVEQGYILDLMRCLHLLNRDERYYLFTEISAHRDVLTLWQIAHIATLLPYHKVHQCREGVFEQATLLNELMKRFRVSREHFITPDELLALVKSADSSIPEKDFLGLLLICSNPLNPDVQSVISNHCPDLKPYLFSLVRRIECGKETETTPQAG